MNPIKPLTIALIAYGLALIGVYHLHEHPLYAMLVVVGFTASVAAIIVAMSATLDRILEKK